MCKREGTDSISPDSRLMSQITPDGNDVFSKLNNKVLEVHLLYESKSGSYHIAVGMKTGTGKGNLHST